jgi:uncharacterized membrane protein YuzA (DUF378 family)
MQETRYFSLLVGVIYLLIGIAGFISGLHTTPPPGAPHLDQNADYGYLFGLFPINVWANVLHIVVGLAGLAAFPRASLARGYCILLFLGFGALTFMGFMPQANTANGWIPLFSGDTWLDAATSLAGAFFAYVMPEPTTMEPAPAAAAH